MPPTLVAIIGTRAPAASSTIYGIDSAREGTTSTRPSLNASRTGIWPGKETNDPIPSRCASSVSAAWSGPEPTSTVRGMTAAGAADAGDRLEQRVDAFGGAQFADVEQVGGVCVGRRRREFRRTDAVGDDAADAVARADVERQSGRRCRRSRTGTRR